MKNIRSITSLCICLLTITLMSQTGPAQEVPATDRRATEIRHLNLTYTFPGYRTREEWGERARSLRRQILVSAGLWPMPQKYELKAQLFGKVDRGDHTIEKVYFESYPGFYVTGNLYRPKNVSGKVPGLLSPHGHSTYGRLENSQHFSGPVRAANFARLGFVVFTYDMVGYGDSTAISHRYGGEREALWGINLLGLQLWNSIRSVDFLLSLPEVDPERIGCTGESGGGTQTFLLAAVDDRIKVAAPVNMISAHMQGGSLCENAPNLRIDTYNVEFGAMMAPRPLLLISATGDWTKDTLRIEYPDIRSIYRLFGAEEKVHAVQIDAPHNYNRESREAAYGWFAHWLLGRADFSPIKERSGGVASLADLMVFYGRPRPENELDEWLLSQQLIQMRKQQLEEARPRDLPGLERFREQFGIALKYSLMAEYPQPEEVIASTPEVHQLAWATEERFALSRRGRGDRVAVTIWRPLKPPSSESFVLLAEASASYQSSLIEQLVKAGHTVMSVVCFPGGKAASLSDELKRFFTTYNRTDEANRVQDILTALAYLNGKRGGARISVVGSGRAGLWALLARGLAPRIDRMIIDAAQFDNTSDEAFLKQLPIPGLRRAGDFLTAITIAPLTPLLVHNTGGAFRTEAIADVYRSLGDGAEFRAQAELLSEAAIVAWLSSGNR